ncbi:molecular chaperone DnaK [Microbacterium mangrovi]|uniref:Molecular chaperone DnaK n=1 Tax=Microbacterium mangrovi TaxID=1348253 RepID=A0A0B2A3C1_9MICO|nr:TraR/DksA C4-type zinc finger protein [Microbacterium mangrovi]KHK96097.1 molecular chaperone DnaK [Microbacterium mangrovi]
MPRTTDPVRRLQERAAALEETLAHLDLDVEEMRAERADGVADDEHDPEGVTLSAEWQRIDALRRSALAEQVQIQSALGRVADGTYGVCIRCGKRIPAGRLEVRPMAAMCVECTEATGG